MCYHSLSLVYYSNVVIFIKNLKGNVFGIYVIGQIIGTIVIIIMTTLGTELVSNIAKWAGEHMIAFMHIVFCSGILLQVIVSLIYFLLTRYIMSKKLNLT